MGETSPTHMSASPCISFGSPSPSTDSEYDAPSSSQDEGGLRVDARFKPAKDERVADRRRRNGESAKRSRQKRKQELGEMENSYGKIMSDNKRLVDENMRLREIVASLGGDASSIPAVTLEPIPEITPESSNNRKSAKRIKSECRVDHTANSFESEATQSPSPQLENTSHQLAVATTVLLLTCCQMATSTIPTNPQIAFHQTSTLTSPNSIGCVTASHKTQPNTSTSPSQIAHLANSIQKWTLPALCSTSDSPHVASHPCHTQSQDIFS